MNNNGGAVNNYEFEVDVTFKSLMGSHKLLESDFDTPMTNVQ